MASRVTGSAVTGSLLLAALVCSSTASAQTEDGGASAPASEPADPQGVPAPTNDPSAEPAPSAGSEPGGGASGFPKALTPQQSLPENLQGWLRERNRRHPALMARPPLAAAPSASAEVEPPAAREAAVEGYKRRLRSFDEGGVTVLSNRHAQPAPPLARVQAAAAVAVPRAAEPEPDPTSFSETRSLRVNPPKSRRVVSDQGLGWPVFALPVAAISLALIWLRKRRTTP